MKKLENVPCKLLLLLCIPFFAAVLWLLLVILASRVSSPSIDLSSAATPTSDYVNNLQIQVLETQLEENRSYNDRLLQVVLWAISGVIATGAILLGFSWFNNYRATEQERLRLQRTESDVQEVRKDNEELHTTLTRMVLDAAISSAGEEVGNDNFPRAYRILYLAANKDHLTHAAKEQVHQLVHFLGGVLDGAYSKRIPLEDLDKELVEELIQLLADPRTTKNLEELEKISAIKRRVEQLALLNRQDDAAPPKEPVGAT